MIGQKYRHLTVLAVAKKGNKKGYLCKCDCGNTIFAQQHYLEKGTSKCCRQCMSEKTSGHNCKLRKGYKEITGSFWWQINNVAASRGHVFKITQRYIYGLLIKQGHTCALSGLPIRIAQSSYEQKSGLHTASLDRINSNLGYVKGNVQWVHKSVNLMKQDFYEEDFIYYCKQVASFQRGKK